MISVLPILQRHAAAEPDRPALICHGQIVTFGDFVDRVQRLAAWLVANGFEPGAPSGIAIQDPIDHSVAMMALAGLGSSQIGLPSQETDAGRAALAARVAARQVVTDRDEPWMEAMRRLAPPFAGLPAVADSGVLGLAFAEDAFPFYQSTSGSTGVPRVFGIRIARIRDVVGRNAVSPIERRGLRAASMQFDANRFQQFTSLLAGNTSVFGEVKALADIISTCARYEVTSVRLGVLALASLCEASDGTTRLPDFTHVSAGGQRVPGALRRLARERLTANLWVQYATSEIGEISLAPPDQHEQFPEGVGLPIANVTVEIVDADDRPVQPGEIGHVRVFKGTAPGGYVADPASSRSFRNGAFYPGDLASWRPGEPIIHHGRADDVMIMNGINILPVSIEDRLMEHPGVREAVAFPIRSRVHGEIPVAAAVLSDGATPARALVAFCRETLGVRAPREVFIVDAVPRNAAGKPLRRELSERFSPKSSRG